MTIEIIGAPFDLCGFRPGSRLGPAALRLADLVETLEALQLRVIDAGDIEAHDPVDHPEGLRHFPALLEVTRNLKREVAEILARGHKPLVLGGEHTLALAGVASALERTNGDLAVLWIDAHADINTPGTSLTGNIHGMPLAALQGLASGIDGQADEDWERLVEEFGSTRLSPQQVMWYGLRDVDVAERERLKPGLAISMHDVDRNGVEQTMRRVDRWIREAGMKHLWVSFDVDALDPFLAPGTGTAVRGGLTYREAHLMAELLHEFLTVRECPYSLLGLDVMETNPIVDHYNETAKMAVEWVASLFGKTIL